MSQGIQPVLAECETLTAVQWEQELRPQWLERWQNLLGNPSFPEEGYQHREDHVASYEGDGFRADWWVQSTGPCHYQNLILLQPQSVKGKIPGAVVPFYHPGQMCGLVLDREDGVILQDADKTEKNRIKQIGLHLVRQGYLVVCVEAFPFNTVPDPHGAHAFDWWHLAALKLQSMHPDWTGLGKLVYDTSRAVDFLLQQPAVDHGRILAMGHSLGGKRAFYTGALDARITCVIGSDFGLPWRSTNWDALWYLGDRVPQDENAMGHQHLLALLAPRSFYLIAGETDTDASWERMAAAECVYRLYPGSVLPTGINHASGHGMTIASLEAAYGWLSQLFHMQPRAWWG